MPRASHSPPSCPDLDFSDCLPTPPSPSPQCKRTRGAPWASKRPRPFFDRLIEHGKDDERAADKETHQIAPQDAHNVASPQLSPQKRKSTDQDSPSRERSRDVDDLLQLLFPEVISLRKDNEYISTHSSPLRATISADQGNSSSSSSTPDKVTTSADTCSTLLPITPPRHADNVHARPDKSDQESWPSTRTTFKPRCTYSSKRTNRSILRTEALQGFESDTGLTTGVRLRQVHGTRSQLTDESEEEDRGSHDDSRKGHSIQAEVSHSPVGTTNCHTNDPSPSKRGLVLDDEPIPRIRTKALLAQGRKSQPGSPLSARPTNNILNEGVAQAIPDGPSYADVYDAEDLYSNLLPIHFQGSEDARTQLVAKHRQYKSYVYERILEYPHRHKDGDPRPGCKALEMGYLVPTPSIRAPEKWGDKDNQAYESVRELRPMILGRVSQTDFKALRDIARKSRSVTVGTSRNHKAQTGNVENTIDDEASDGRKKPLSRLNRHIVAHNHGTEATVRKHGSRSAASYLDRGKTQKTLAIRTTSKRKKRQKQGQIPTGHRPLALKYPSSKVNANGLGQHDDIANADEAPHLSEPDKAVIHQTLTSQDEQVPIDPDMDQGVCQDTTTAPRPSNVDSLADVTGKNLLPVEQERHAHSEALPADDDQQQSGCAPSVTESARPINTAITEEVVPHICDILMPLTPQTKSSNATKLFTLRTTNTTKVRATAISDLYLVLDTDTSDRDCPEPPLGLRNDASKNEITTCSPFKAGRSVPTHSSIIEGIDHMVLAQASCSAVTHEEGTPLPLCGFRASEDRDFVLAKPHLTPDQSNYHNSEGRFTHLYFTEPALEVYDDEDEARMGCIFSDSILDGDRIPSSALPAAHQPKFATSSSYWEDFYDETCPIPTDIEQEYYEYYEGYEYDYHAVAFSPMEVIPSPQPVPPSPEEYFSGVEMSLQTKLGAYGRRVVDPEHLPIKGLPGQATKLIGRRTIAQDTPPPRPAQSAPAASPNDPLGSFMTEVRRMLETRDVEIANRHVPDASE